MNTLSTVTGERQARHRIGGRRAFSLIEFTAVLALMAILAGVVTVSVRHFTVKGKQNAARIEIATLRDAVEAFHISTGRYPTNDEGLAVLAQRGAAGAEPLISQVASDPWGHPYVYNQPGRNGPYEIICLGADGRDGGEGGDADIASWDLKSGAK